MTSWKTTAAGIGAILTAAGMALSAHFDADSTTVADWGAVLAASLVADNDGNDVEVAASCQ
jgi:hypothetical protein